MVYLPKCACLPCFLAKVGIHKSIDGLHSNYIDKWETTLAASMLLLLFLISLSSLHWINGYHA